MSAFDAFVSAIGEGMANVAGRIVRRKMKLGQQDAQRIGELVVIGLVAAFFIVLAAMGVGT